MSTKTSKIIIANSKVLRGVNRTAILNIIRERQPISRVNIARLTGLNKSTVSSIVLELLEEELIYEQASEEQNIGRSPINLFLKSGKYFVGAINIDSSITRFAITDVDGSIIGSSSIITAPGDPERFIKACSDELKSLRIQFGITDLEGVGISIAGIVDSQNRIVKYAPNLGWENFHIGDVLDLYFEQKVSIGNDAKASALAELWFGDHKLSSSNFVFLSIGNGIGSGIVLDNKLIKGEFQAAGEFGHISIFEGGEPCSCGNSGCLESYASYKAIIKRYTAITNASVNENTETAIEDIINLAQKNDTAALEVIKRTGYYLGLGISNIIKAIDPHTIIIGGRITQLWKILFPEIEKVLMEHTFFGQQKQTRILPTSLKILPRLLGAATLAIKEIFDGYKITA